VYGDEAQDLAVPVEELEKRSVIRLHTEEQDRTLRLAILHMQITGRVAHEVARLSNLVYGLLADSIR
jgi:hypothetical protein